LQSLQATLQQHNIAGTASHRPKILGTRLVLSRKHVAAAEDEQQRLQKATRLAKWIKSIPGSTEKKLYFYKATALAVLAAPAYSRLFSQRDLAPLSTAFLNLAKGNTLVIMAAATGKLSRLHWQDAQTVGPVAQTHTWMRRLEHPNAPWTWHHRAKAMVLSTHTTAEVSARTYAQQQNLQHTHVNRGSSELLAHVLREAWRAQQWAAFLCGDSRAAVALQQLTWQHVADRFKQARQMWHTQNGANKAHLLATFTNKWWSQAKFAQVNGLDMPTCAFCQQQEVPTRHHEWRCTGLRGPSPVTPDNVLFQHLGWPRGRSDAGLLLELCEVREK
ncbi:unnamed protein product, partial [Effrenium voratum]